MTRYVLRLRGEVPANCGSIQQRFERISNEERLSEESPKRSRPILYRIFGHHSMPFRHALLARSSISSVMTGPLVRLLSMASTTASATTSACSGFSTAAPNIGLSLLPDIQLRPARGNVPYANGTVKNLDESYKNPGLMKIFRISGNREAIVDSASRLVVMYLPGNIGAPPAADIKTKVLTFFAAASCARAIAGKFYQQV